MAQPEIDIPKNVETLYTEIADRANTLIDRRKEFMAWFRQYQIDNIQLFVDASLNNMPDARETIQIDIVLKMIQMVGIKV